MVPSSASSSDLDRLRSGLAPALADLGQDPSGLLFPDAPGLGARLLAVDAGTPPARDGRVERTLAGLGETDLFALWLPEPPEARRMAAWRDALWPDVHLFAWYRFDGGTVRRKTLQSGEDVGQSDLSGVLLVGRRTRHVMSPEATVEKFDGNAAGWDGEPGGPGYPHFRWMRRFVGLYAPVPEGARILDFGCGAGWVGIEAASSSPGTSLCAFDPSPEMVRIAERNAHAAGVRDFTGRTGFGEDPPFPAEGEAPFDLVISSGVVSFSPDEERWLDGLARAVRPGGTLVVGDIHGASVGFRRRRSRKPLLPVRELNAKRREAIRAGLEQRGFRFERWSGYQLSWPVPQLMHVNEQRLGGVLTWPLLGLNRVAAGLDRALGSPAQGLFDSWVMRLHRPD